MNQSTDVIHQAFAIFLFCIAVTILFVTYRSYITTLNHSKKIQKEDILQEQYKDSKVITVTKGEIMTLLFHDLEYDVEIDGNLISKSVNVKENITTYPFDFAKYIKTYAYDDNGNITRIILKGL